jgi:hypothetical protein
MGGKTVAAMTKFRSTRHRQGEHPFMNTRRIRLIVFVFAVGLTLLNGLVYWDENASLSNELAAAIGNARLYYENLMVHGRAHFVEYEVLILTVAIACYIAAGWKRRSPETSRQHEPSSNITGFPRR